LAQQALAASRGAAKVLSCTLGQLIACTRRAQVFLGGDTGPLHLAAALQRPVVGIFGPTDPERNGPFSARARVLRHPGSRRNHARHKQPEAGLLTITVEDAVQAIRQLLQETGA
jgi:heptosyltransferase-1